MGCKRATMKSFLFTSCFVWKNFKRTSAVGGNFCLVLIVTVLEERVLFLMWLNGSWVEKVKKSEGLCRKTAVVTGKCVLKCLLKLLLLHLRGCLK